jgi:anti-anti-sigma factor
MPHISDFSQCPSPGPDSLVCHTAYFDTSWPEPDTAVVAAHGELDAANGIEFVSYALRHEDRSRFLVIDLSGLSFFSTAGFSALHTLNVQCVRADIRWALVPGKAVKRVLRLCDPDSVLPTSPDIDEALTSVHTEPPRLLELVTEPS